MCFLRTEWRTFLLLSAFFAVVGSSAFAVPLTRGQIENASKIGVLLGTFDPVHDGHLRFAEQAALEFGLEYILFLPTQYPAGKSPVPYQSRLEMIHIATQNKTSVGAPSADFAKDVYENFGEIAVLDWVRTVNPKIEIYSLIGEDILEQPRSILKIWSDVRPKSFIVSNRDHSYLFETLRRLQLDQFQFFRVEVQGYSSSQIRKELTEKNLKSDFSSEISELKSDVRKYIFHNGLYMMGFNNRIRYRSRVVSLFRNQVLDFIKLLGLTDLKSEIMDQISNWSTQRKEKRFESFVWRNQKLDLYFLGEGYASKVFVFQIQGQKYVLKIAKSARMQSTDYARDARYLNWINGADLPFKAPKVFDFSNDWMITEFVSGSLLKDIVLQNRAIPKELLVTLQKTLRFVQDHKMASGYSLDLTLDNLIWKDDELFLVDVGPTNRPIAKSLAALLDEWKMDLAKKDNFNVDWGCDTVASGLGLPI